MNDHRSEYGLNGNGKPKAFDLVPPKSPEEIARDEVRASMPKIRRECSRDPRLKRNVGAKWLFAQLADDSFMNVFGGDGFGKIFTTLRELQRRYGHDSATISEWLGILEECGWVWVRRSWPTWCIGIASVSRQPDLFVPEYVRVQARASGQIDPLASGQHPPENDKMARNGHNSGEPPVTGPSPAKSVLASGQSTNGESPIHQPPVTDTEPGESPIHRPSVASGLTVSGQRTNGHSPTAPTVSDGHNKETPKETGRLGANGGGGEPPPDFENWKSEVRELFPSKRRALCADLLSDLSKAAPEQRQFFKERIAFIKELAQGGKPPPVTKRIVVGKSKPSEPVKPLSDEELIAHADWCRDNKKLYMLSPEMKRRLKTLEVAHA